MNTVTRMHVLLLVAAVVACLPSAPEARPQELGTFRDWTAFSDSEGSGKICYTGSQPQKEEGDYTQRGTTYVLVTHRPNENVFGEISVEAGYPYAADSKVEAEIDGTSVKLGGQPITLFTKGSNAWAHDPAADRALIGAMQAGGRMVIRGRSGRGTLTTDTYSLLGFTAAYNAIGRACGAR